MSSNKGQDRNKNWEHSRYKDWRPSHMDQDAKARERRARRYDERRRGSFLGWLFRLAVTLALIVALFGPGGDYLNGRAKAEAEACAVRVVVDGDTVLTGCPDGGELPKEVAGYDAPEMLRPGCMAEFTAALMAGLEIRKALYSADSIVLRGGGGVPPVSDLVPPESEPSAPEAGEADAAEGGDAPAAPDGTPGDAAEPEPDAADDTPPPSPAVIPRAGLVVLVDGTDLAEVMLASGHVQPTGGPGWCG